MDWLLEKLFTRLFIVNETTKLQRVYQSDLPWASLDLITVFVVVSSVNTSITVMAPFTVWGSQALGSIGLNSIEGPVFFWLDPQNQSLFRIHAGWASSSLILIIIPGGSYYLASPFYHWGD